MNSRMKPSSSPPPPKKVNANPKKDFNEMVSVYIDNINDGESVRQIRNRQRARDSVRHEPPVEKPLTKLNYDNVVKFSFRRVFHGQRRRDAFIASSASISTKPRI
jgi:hypothetical protein